jgi:multiple sugar transport system permease protein
MIESRAEVQPQPVSTIRAGALQRNVGRAALYAVLGFLAFLYAMPFVWMLSTSVKPSSQVYLMPPVWIPETFNWGNYVNPWYNMPFHLFYLNTIIVTLAATTGTLLSSSLVAFAFARMRFRGREFLFMLVLSTIILPQQVTLIPQYLIFTKLGWINTLGPLIIPYWFGTAFNIFLVRQYMMTLPLEIDDAARIDGASWFQLYSRIVMPLSAPALGVVAIGSFNFHWNEYLHPLLYLNETKNFTVALGLPLLNSRYITDVQQTMAQTVIAVIPVMIVFFFAQRFYIQGVVVSGVKG